MPTQSPENTDIKDVKEGLELDPSIFAHIHLDHRLLGSHLQGSSFNLTVGYILGALEYFSNEEKEAKETKETLESVSAIVATLVNNTETKKTLEKVNAQFQTLMNIESQIDIAKKMVCGYCRLYWGERGSVSGDTRTRETVYSNTDGALRC